MIMYLDLMQKIREIIENLDNPEYKQQNYDNFLITTIVIIAAAVILLIVVIKGLISSASFAQKVGYSMISPLNITLASIPLLLVSAVEFLEIDQISDTAIYITIGVCLAIILLRNIIGCKLHIGYTIFYTLVQAFIGFTIGALSIAAIGLAIFALVVIGGFVYRHAETYNIVLTPESEGIFSTNYIRTRIDPHNHNQLLGEHGEIFEANGSGTFSLISTLGDEDLFETYIIRD